VWLPHFVRCATKTIPALHPDELAVILQGLADLEYKPQQKAVFKIYSCAQNSDYGEFEGTALKDSAYEHFFIDAISCHVDAMSCHVDSISCHVDCMSCHVLLSASLAGAVLQETLKHHS
jgi:hypothetical protein